MNVRIRLDREYLRSIGIPDQLMLGRVLTSVKDEVSVAVMDTPSSELESAITSAFERVKERIRDTKGNLKHARSTPVRIDTLNEETYAIESNLYTSHLPQSSPDMILRTSGEKRLSGFLMWQSAYSELVFMDIFWPEFRKIDLMRAIRTFQERKRRLGK